mmetsp:Transcript_23377/g.38624  ORF Transcript_23377/g.38624 Transcript_23377/m.38624 type:complete len:108 (-) Transcript_23377:1252-1575(-)
MWQCKTLPLHARVPLSLTTDALEGRGQLRPAAEKKEQHELMVASMLMRNALTNGMKLCHIHCSVNHFCTPLLALALAAAATANSATVRVTRSADVISRKCDKPSTSA